MHEIDRRIFLQSVAAGGVSAALLPSVSNAKTPPKKKTRFIAAYDTEHPGCLAACRKIVKVHKRFKMPATFFIVGRTLEAHPDEYRKLLDDPLFEIASHTYSHRMLRNQPFCGHAVSPEDRKVEIFKGKEVVDKIFKTDVIGLRPGCGFDNAFVGAPKDLAMIKEAGFKYVSSLLWGPDYSLPAVFKEPFNYASDGFADLWELPGHGFHENLLKDNNGWGPRRLTLWPPPFPGAIPDHFAETPEDEFKVNKVFIDRAIATNELFYSPIWHPWSMGKFDPEMKMLELLFEYVQKREMHATTYVELYKHVAKI